MQWASRNSLPLLAVVLFASSFGVLPAVAGESAKCWQLVDIQTRSQQWSSGELVNLPPEKISSHLALDSPQHWVEYDNPDYSGGRAYARAIWSAPPQRFCGDDKISYQFWLENKAIGKGTNNFASVSWGPDDNYGKRAFGRLTLAQNKASSSRQRETQMRRGQSSLEDAATWNAKVEIGDMSAHINYRYLPVTHEADRRAPNTEGREFIAAEEQAKRKLAAIENIDLETISKQLLPQVNPGRVEIKKHKDTGKPESLSYSFAAENIEQDIYVDTTVQFDINGDKAQPSIQWVIRNESDQNRQVTYIADLPKSFATTVANIKFSMPPTEIIRDDPLVKWLIDTSATLHQRIEARSILMLTLSHPDNMLDLLEQIRPQLMDIQFRRQLVACQRIEARDHGVSTAVCTLIAIANNRHLVNSNICKGLDDIDNNGPDEFDAVFVSACHKILDPKGLDECKYYGDRPDLGKKCRMLTQHVLATHCEGLTGIDKDMCLYDIAVVSGYQNGCNTILNKDLARDCRAKLTGDPVICKEIKDPDHRSACCEIFKSEKDKYSVCMDLQEVSDGTGTSDTAESKQPDEPPSMDTAPVIGTKPKNVLPKPLMRAGFFADYRCVGDQGQVRIAWNGNNFTYGRPGKDEVLQLPADKISSMPLDDHGEFFIQSSILMAAPSLWLPLSGEVYTIPKQSIQNTENHYVGFVKNFSELRFEPSPDTQFVMGKTIDTTIYRGDYTEEYINDDREGNVFVKGYTKRIDHYSFEAWYHADSGLLVKGRINKETTTCYEEGDYLGKTCPVEPLELECILIDTSLPL